MNRKSVAIVDGHPLVIEGLSNIMQRTHVFSLNAVGSIAGDICSIADRYHPDVIVVDLNVPGDAIQAIANSAISWPDSKIVVFTASTDPNDAVSAFEAGARGYVLKDSSASSLIEAIETTCRGEIYITPSFAIKVISALQKKSIKKKELQIVRLSVREDQIVNLLLRGKKNREIAADLWLSEKTIKGYMTSLMHKLNARSRVEVVIAAHRLNQKMLESDATS